MLKRLIAVSLFGMLCSQAHAAELTWKGDVRYRHELNSDGLGTINGRTTSHLHRLMFRAGAIAKLNDDTDVEFRLGTAGGRTSLNQTLGESNNSFSNYNIRLDRAAFTWKKMDVLTLMGGRHKNSFFMAGGSDLVWDGDLNFDGLAMAHACGSDEMRIFANAGAHWLNAGSTAATSPDQHLLSLQLGSKMKLADVELGVGAGVHNYTDMAGRLTPSTSTGVGIGNTLNGANFANDFRILNAGIEATSPMMGLPVSLLFDYATNMAVTTEKTGWLAGLKVGKTKKEGDWYFGYDYRTVQKDSVVAQFADSDSFLGLGTNGKGHRVRAAYSISDPVVVTATAYLGKVGIASGETETRRNKGQLDLSFSF